MDKKRVKQGWLQLRAIRPSHIRKAALGGFQLEIVADTELQREDLIRVFVPDQLQGAERRVAWEHLAAPGEGGLCVRAPGAAGTGVEINPAEPEAGLREFLRTHSEHRLALGRVFPPIRDLLARELIRAMASRNAAIAAISALPEVIPNPLSLLLAVGEMGSDTVLITANQLRLAFELAAIRGEDVGWRAQAAPVLGIMTAALGWRTLARELVGMIPAGIGLAAKTGIAYSGTLAAGEALWRLPRNRRRRPALAQPGSMTTGALESKRRSCKAEGGRR